MTMKNRATGWLGDTLHHDLTGILFHALSRERLGCLAYTLMPDHAHFLIIGLSDQSDQATAIRWFRREWNSLLDPMELERQAFDDLLREKDRERDALQSTAHYIFENPVRAGLVEQWQDWPYSGCCLPGYPHLDPRKSHYWVNFWKAHAHQVQL